jgi:lysophospholipase L1-like esterase
MLKGLCAATVGLLIGGFAPVALAQSVGPERFAPEMEAFAAADRAAPPPGCQIVFTGSSSIRFWKTLAQDMAPIPVINRGFGGSQISDVNAFFDRVATPYRPRAIFFYAGENDINAGETPEQVAADFGRFMDLKTAKLGAAPVYFIALKPSKARLDQKPLQDAVNAKIRAMAQARADLDYVDVVPAMLEADGRPKDIFVADGLHMTPAGYELWTAVVRPVAETAAKAPC